MRREPARCDAMAFGAAVALCGLLVACGVRAETGADGEEINQEEPRGALTSGGSFYVEWAPDPDPIPLNEIFLIRFRVLDPTDREVPIHNAVITANAWMPDHKHGTTLEPRIEIHGDGTATAEGFLMHMEGYWQLGVGVAVSGRMERATFDIQLQP